MGADTMSSGMIMRTLLSIFIVFVSFSPVALSQDPTTLGAQCVQQLLPLAACAPYVQGASSTPAQTCCDNLKQLDAQQPQCLCLLLNQTFLSSFPINRTRALLLPLICNIQVDVSICSAANMSSSPGSQISLGSPDTNSSTGANSTNAIAASPMFQPVPRSPSNVIGYGLSKSSSISLKTGSDITVVMVAALVTFVLIIKVIF